MGQVAKLFMNGRSQAVRLPAKYRFEGTEVDVRDGPEPGEVILSPKMRNKRSWDELFAYIDSLKLTEEELATFDNLRDKSPPPRDPFGDD